MGWEQRLIAERELEPFLPAAADFSDRLLGLQAQQREMWPMLREAIAGLERVESRKLPVKNSIILAQHNPRRIISAIARVDAQTIKQRPCFLCPENLPVEEKAMTFGQDFVALCNPFPVLKNHLVIASRRHTPQLIEGNFELMLDLAGDLGDKWFTLYNGPRCGASAPDHLHFQSCAREGLPIFPEIETWELKMVDQFRQLGPFGTFSLADYRINLLVTRSSDRQLLIGWFNETIARLAMVSGESEEPMINLIVTHDDDGWTVIVFPRSKHRPSCYYAEGEAKLIVSPAAIDLAGVLIVPRAEDFARIGAVDIEKIYAEVTLDDERFSRIQL